MSQIHSRQSRPEIHSRQVLDLLKKMQKAIDWVSNLFDALTLFDLFQLLLQDTTGRAIGFILVTIPIIIIYLIVEAHIEKNIPAKKLDSFLFSRNWTNGGFAGLNQLPWSKKYLWFLKMVALITYLYALMKLVLD